MKVYFVRHGESEANRQCLHAGWSGVPLSELGRQQALQAGRRLEGISFDRVFCSDLLRAKQTAALALPDYAPIYSEKLREINVGTLSGRRVADCRAEYGAMYDAYDRQQDFSPFGGETQAQIHARIVSFAHELEALTDVDTAAVFGHEGTVHQMLNYTLGGSIMLEHLRITNTSITVFSYEHGIWTLLQFGGGECGAL